MGKTHWLRPVAVLGALFSLAACGGAAAPAASAVPSKPAAAQASASGGWQAEWDRVLAAAKQEGQVNVTTPSGSAQANLFEGFKARYGINVNVTAQSAGTLLAKLGTERAAGQYLQDVSLNATNTTTTGLKPINALDPLPPAFINPDVTDDKNWIGGFAAGWADSGKNLDYSTGRLAEPVVHVNRKFVPESQLSHIEQLWDPAWKGKIVMGDTRVPSTATPMLGAWLQVFGDDKVKAFFQTQQPVVTNQPRQMAEWLVRGQYPIAFGVGVPDMTFLTTQGVDTSQIKPLAVDEPGGVVADDGTGSIALFSHAPHPNAAKILINWLLSQEGQTAISKATGYNSRRTDVAPIDPSTVIDPKKNYPHIQTEDTYPVFQHAMQVSKEMIK